MTTRILLFACISVLLITSCKKNSHYEDADVLTIAVHDSLRKDIKDIVTEWQIIELEDTLDGLMPQIFDMGIVDDKIYCFCTELGGYVAVFDMQGKFLFKIQHRGKAKNEWIRLTSFFLNTKEKCMLLTDYDGKKVLKYDLDGKHIQTYPMNEDDCTEVAMDGRYLYSITSLLATGGIIDAGKNDYKVHIYNENGTFEDEAVPTRYDDTGIIQFRSWNDLTMSYNHKLFYAPVMDEYIYEIKGDTVSKYAKYEYSGNKKLMDNDDIAKIKELDRFVQGTNGYTFYTNDFIDTPDYIYRRMGHTEAFDIIYDKRSQKSYITQFDAPFLTTRGISSHVLYPAPLTFHEGRFYAPFLTQVFGFPEKFIKGKMPKELELFYQKYQQNKLNALIISYKLNL